MINWRVNTHLAALTIAALIPLPTQAGLFTKTNQGCEGAPPPCYVGCEDCQKPKKQKRFKDAPVAPVVSSIPAVMVNQAAIPAPPAQTQSEQLKQLRDMLVETNQAIQNARQSASQQSAPATDDASVEALKKEVSELRTSLQSLTKTINEFKSNPERLK